MSTEEINDKFKKDLNIDNNNNENENENDNENDNDNLEKEEVKIQEIKLKDKYKTNKNDLDEANQLKSKGNQTYTSGDYQASLELYNEAISILKKEEETGYEDDQHETNDEDNSDNEGHTTTTTSTTNKKPKSKIIEIRENTEDDVLPCFEELSILYSNRSACYLALKKYDFVVKDCNIALEYEPTPSPIKIKILHRRAQAREQLNKLKDALEDYQEILKLDPSFPQAVQANKRLPPKIKEKEDREREEMMGKLKDLGNTILGKFGLSTDNFQFVKDPNSGGYSVNFKK
ncbi:hypothetical protein DICPUDRAFT_26389 [Dictyostelium purpureum]|uniref:Tetratricopeptide repeat protein 1 n=1 Tax=Dictyostelium purpureum TaxID=5786 RepID=F0Z8I8_DICPU|nr:uncharacterized protein DICPUDRAFT_26389 [Dictyostelium purpureum]EGC39734.1 hypothetical protein DICPUDRAFT_26389 [Dictyostelium purpureum]|eukprot:XP_003283720.1 hypothetical protein DICPUDRAFT_26389 [Dictyostelium purpureum]